MQRRSFMGMLAAVPALLMPWRAEAQVAVAREEQPRIPDATPAALAPYYYARLAIPQHDVTLSWGASRRPFTWRFHQTGRANDAGKYYVEIVELPHTIYVGNKPQYGLSTGGLYVLPRETKLLAAHVAQLREKYPEADIMLRELLDRCWYARHGLKCYVGP